MAPVLQVFKNVWKRKSLHNWQKSTKLATYFYLDEIPVKYVYYVVNQFTKFVPLVLDRLITSNRSDG